MTLTHIIRVSQNNVKHLIINSPGRAQDESLCRLQNPLVCIRPAQLLLSELCSVILSYVLPHLLQELVKFLPLPVCLDIWVTPHVNKHFPGEHHPHGATRRPISRHFLHPQRNYGPFEVISQTKLPLTVFRQGILFCDAGDENLACTDADVHLGVECIPASHLVNIHPAGKAQVRETLEESFNLRFFYNCVWQAHIILYNAQPPPARYNTHGYLHHVMWDVYHV
jgi:hypothetical protein